jgi:hypothetical protein
MTSIRNISLYIKRAEADQDEEYIKTAFAKAYYGDVKSVKFIPKEDQYGNKYNGVIVHFDRWYSTVQVRKLFEELSKANDGICRLYHDVLNSRYWNVMEYTDVNNLSEVLICDELQNIQTLYKQENNNQNQEYIDQLEKLVSSMASQMGFLQKQLKQTEEKLYITEINTSQVCLKNAELLCQLNEKDIEVSRAKQETLKLTLENANLRYCLEKAEQEINDTQNILHYVDNECLEMKSMLLQSKLESKLTI